MKNTFDLLTTGDLLKLAWNLLKDDTFCSNGRGCSPSCVILASAWIIPRFHCLATFLLILDIGLSCIVGPRSGECTSGFLRELRNSIKSGLSTPGSSNYDILGGQETEFSFTFLTKVLVQTFIKVSSVIPMQEIAASINELLLRLSYSTSDFVREIQYYLHTQGLALFSENLILLISCPSKITF